MRQVDVNVNETVPSWLTPTIALLVIAHLVAVGYWIFRLASDKPPPRRKIQ